MMLPLSLEPISSVGVGHVPRSFVSYGVSYAVRSPLFMDFRATP